MSNRCKPIDRSVVLGLILALFCLASCDAPDPTPNFCANQGGRYETQLIKIKDSLASTGVCVFANNTVCGSLDFYRGTCKSGQIAYVRHVRLQALIDDLKVRGIAVAPNKQFWGGQFSAVVAAVPYEADYLRETSFALNSGEILFVHISETTAKASTLAPVSPANMDDLYSRSPSLKAQIKGFIHYYQCDEVTLVYAASQQTEASMKVDSALAALCGPIVAHYASIIQ